MKKILSLVLTLTLAVAFFGFSAQAVNAEVPASDCTTDKVVVIHYKRWNDDYEGKDFWAWGGGTAGSGNPQIVGQDDFGAVAYFCVDEDADHEAGLIPRQNDWSYKDGADTDGNGEGGDDKHIQLREESDDDELTTEAFVGFDENGVKHVYVLQGASEVFYNDPAMPMFQKDGFGTVVVVYYDPVESYDGWNMWTWGTGTDGTQAPNLFQWELGVDQGVAGKYRVAVFNIAADADDTIGFIVRTDAWEKQWDEDLFLDVTAVKGSGTQFTFYMGGAPDFYDNYTDFDAQVNLFEILELGALDQHSIELEFNKDVITKDELGALIVDKTLFEVTDKDGNVIAIDKISFDTVADANTAFTIITEDALMGMASPFNVKYMPNETDMYELGFAVDSTPPVIDIAGFTEVSIELGDTYQLPIYSSSDFNGEESVKVTDLKIKEGFGTVDTRNAGIYEIVIVATDNFGNFREATITVTVTDPCDETAHLNASNNTTNLIALLVAAPLAVGAFVTLRKQY